MEKPQSKKLFVKENLEYLKLACETFFALEKVKSTVGAVLGDDKKGESKETKQKIHLMQKVILLGVIKDVYNELKGESIEKQK